MLPVIAESVDGMLSAATKMHRMLTDAKSRPPLLDMATVERLIRAHTQQKDDLWLFKEQLHRWQTLPPDAASRRKSPGFRGNCRDWTPASQPSSNLLENCRQPPAGSDLGG